MITLTASGSSVIFTFDGNSTYLNDGAITVPKNSLALIIDESDMATFRKAASNDIFVSANIAEFGMTKDELMAWYKANMVSSSGGGGGVTPEEVEEMIDEAVSGKADSSDVYTTGQTSGATQISSALAEKLAVSDFNTYSGNVATALSEKASQSTVNALSGVVASHTADTSIHLTSGDVQNQISGKANSDDVYLKTETSGATELATAFAAKQDQLIAGENITISGNVISSEGGGCEVEETIIYDRITGGYVDSDGKNKASFVILDYLGDKSTNTYDLGFIIGDANNDYVNAYINFDYPNHSSSSTDTGITEYLTVEYVNDIQDFKVTIKPVYQSSVWIKQMYNVGTDMNLLVPFYTINSGSPCTVISTDVVGLSTKIKNIADKSVSEVYLKSGKDNLGLNYSRHNGLGGSSDIRLEELDGSNNKLKPNIQVPLGVSGWTEVGLSDSTCDLSDSKVKGFTTFRISGDTTQLNNWNLQIAVGYNNNYTWDSVQWDDNENTFVLSKSWDMFSAATATWDSNTGYLTVSYPQTVTVDGEERQTEFYYVNSQQCQYGNAITKFEYYAELQQALKPYVQETRAALGGLSLVKLTKAEYDALATKDNSTLYVIVN